MSLNPRTMNKSFIRRSWAGMEAGVMCYPRLAESMCVALVET